MRIHFYKFLCALFLLLNGVNSMAKPVKLPSSFNAPTGIAFDSKNAMYVTNWSGDSIAKIDVNGNETTFFSDIASPAGIAIDEQDQVYVASYSGNYILRITPQGVGSIVSEGFSTPTGIAFGRTGELLITNRASGEIVALDVTSGKKQVIASGFITPVGVTELVDRSLVVSQYSGALTLVTPDGRRKELGAGFTRPGVGIIALSEHQIAVIDNGAGAVREVNTNTGQSTVLADGLPGAVALALYRNHYYIGTWNNNSVYTLDK